MMATHRASGRKYVVLALFTDLQDKDHLYDVGDPYPRDGLKPSAERIAELMSSDNKQGKALIKEA